MPELNNLLITASTDIRTYIALGSLIFAIIAYRRHKRKRLLCEMISNVPLFSVQHEIKHRVKILLDDVLVENVNLVLIRISNLGNDAITSKDFESPIVVSLGNVAKILSVEISETSPADLPANISYSDSSVKLEPLLMNQNDSITIKALVSKPNNTITVSGRIVGVKKIEERDEETQLSARMRLLTILSLILSPVFMLIAPLRGQMRNHATALWILQRFSYE